MTNQDTTIVRSKIEVQLDVQYSKSRDMTSSGENGPNIRTNASSKRDRTRCPEEQASSVG